jgi:hypothetical protein|tara:strand:+ start:49 stop:714 length:666 start_codon:yes stop_codon:yes gene_type:complete
LKSTAPNLSIFETFKTKREQLTGEAIRQRHIISHLAKEDNPTLMTRTAIAQNIAQKNNLLWKNIYSGVFRDLDEILIPLDIVREAGRLPLKRGPKALQEKGVPYYNLTPKGLLVALSIDDFDQKDSVLDKFLSKAEIKEKGFADVIKTLVKISPKFTYSMFEIYVRAFCEGKIKNLMPFRISEFREISGKTFTIQNEILTGFVTLSKSKQLVVLNFLSKFT